MVTNNSTKQTSRQIGAMTLTLKSDLEIELTSGMETGAAEMWDRLEEHLRTMA